MAETRNGEQRPTQSVVLPYSETRGLCPPRTRARRGSRRHCEYFLTKI